jgi:gluconate kinase
MGLVVSFGGRSGSGKSSITAALAEALGWRRASFGDYLRLEIARRGGDPGCRKAQQDLGLSLVENDVEDFCRAVLDCAGFQPGDDLLVDGVRHVKAQESIRSIVAPSQARLVYLASDDGTRLQRVSTRPDGRGDFLRADLHRVEVELIEIIPSWADAVLDSSGDLSEAVDCCHSLIVKWRSSRP